MHLMCVYHHRSPTIRAITVGLMTGGTGRQGSNLMSGSVGDATQDQRIVPKREQLKEQDDSQGSVL